MARKLRLGYSVAIYHVVNRGNYRQAVFATVKTKQTFEHCLFEAYQRYNWQFLTVR